MNFFCPFLSIHSWLLLKKCLVFSAKSSEENSEPTRKTRNNKERERVLSFEASVFMAGGHFHLEMNEMTRTVEMTQVDVVVDLSLSHDEKKREMESRLRETLVEDPRGFSFCDVQVIFMFVCVSLCSSSSCLRRWNILWPQAWRKMSI